MAVRFPLFFHALSSRSFNSVTKLSVSQFLFLSWKDPLIRWTGLAQESDGDGDPSCEAQVQNSASVPMTSKAKIGSRAYYNLLNPFKSYQSPMMILPCPNRPNRPNLLNLVCRASWSGREITRVESMKLQTICSIWFHWFIWNCSIYCFEICSEIHFVLFPPAGCKRLVHGHGSHGSANAGSLVEQLGSAVGTWEQIYILRILANHNLERKLQYVAILAHQFSAIMQRRGKPW